MRASRAWQYSAIALAITGCGGTRAARDAAQPRSGPSPTRCEALWNDYRLRVPVDPHVDRSAFLARCARSEPAVLTCLDRTRDELASMLRQSRALHAAADREVTPPHEQPDTASDSRALDAHMESLFLPRRMGICMTRERVRFALRTGELHALAREVIADRYPVGAHGAIVVAGSYETLAWRGFHEGGASPGLAPLGELRITRRPSGTVWIYMLGSLLGRHQNQVAFLYSNRPFAARDFSALEDGVRRVCIDHDEREDGYVLSCFRVLATLAPQLLEIGSAPD